MRNHVRKLIDMKNRKNDEYTPLVLSTTDNVEYFKQEVVVSCKNVFTVAHEALQNMPNLEKVVVMEHAPRFDVDKVDPISLKPALAKLANTTFNNLWMDSPWKSKIIISGHNLQCNDKERAARYTGRN